MRSLITAFSLSVAFFIAQPAKAQYSGNDDTIKVQEPTAKTPENPVTYQRKKHQSHLRTNLRSKMTMGVRPQ